MLITKIAAMISASVLCAGIAHSASGGKAVPQPKGREIVAVHQTEVTQAYLFRPRVLADYQCQKFSMKADELFFDEKLSDEKKVAELKQIEALAQASACLGR